MDKHDLHAALTRLAGCDVWTEQLTRADFDCESDEDEKDYSERPFDLRIGVSPNSYQSGVDVRSVVLEIKDGERAYKLWPANSRSWDDYMPTIEERDLLQKIYEAYLLLA